MPFKTHFFYCFCLSKTACRFFDLQTVSKKKASALSQIFTHANLLQGVQHLLPCRAGLDMLSGQLKPAESYQTVLLGKQSNLSSHKALLCSHPRTNHRAVRNLQELQSGCLRSCFVPQQGLDTSILYERSELRFPTKSHFTDAGCSSCSQLRALSKPCSKTALRSKTILSGEIFKESFTDIFQTALEQVALSLECNDNRYQNNYKTTLWKQLRFSTNRRLSYFTTTKTVSSPSFSPQKREPSTRVLYDTRGDQKKKDRISLHIKIGDYLSSGDKVGEKRFLVGKSDAPSGQKEGFAQILFPSNALTAYRCKASLSLFWSLHQRKRHYLQLAKLNQAQVARDRVRHALFASLSKAGLYAHTLSSRTAYYTKAFSLFTKHANKNAQARLRTHKLLPSFESKACRARTCVRRGDQHLQRICTPKPNRNSAAFTVYQPAHVRTCAYRAKLLRSLLTKKSSICTDIALKDATGRYQAELCNAYNLAKLGSVHTNRKLVRVAGIRMYLKKKAERDSPLNNMWNKRCKAKKEEVGGYFLKNEEGRSFKRFRTPIVLNSSGRVVAITKTQLVLQKTQPILFYNSARLHVKKGEWIKEGSPILTLTHQTLITGDIVQGIPRIEQLFEAFTSPPFKNKQTVTRFKDAHETLHSQVRDIFRKHWLESRLPIAVRKSLEEIGYILVEMIQKVYLSQGVLIADKHIEIIIRQIASKGQILDSGTTGLFLEEVLPIRQIENANLTTPGKKCLYVPAVMGLTAASLNSDSFISAASFQETTRVLSRDAVVGKTDFLRGLKEKVVIGDLISAGTGLDIYFIYTTMLASL